MPIEPRLREQLVKWRERIAVAPPAVDCIPVERAAHLCRTGRGNGGTARMERQAASEYFPVWSQQRRHTALTTNAVGKAQADLPRADHVVVVAPKIEVTGLAYQAVVVAHTGFCVLVQDVVGVQ